MLLKILRNTLGQIIIFFDFITRPKKITRSKEQQNQIDSETKNLSLYQFHACPFCVKTRRNIRRLNLNIEYRDAKNNTDFRQELETQGGEIKVPCLRIEKGNEVEWMYESNDIIQYLNNRFEQAI